LLYPRSSGLASSAAELKRSEFLCFVIY
jgi:hypothetical protein